MDLRNPIIDESTDVPVTGLGYRSRTILKMSVLVLIQLGPGEAAPEPATLRM